jgi:hypothetical protein
MKTILDYFFSSFQKHSNYWCLEKTLVAARRKFNAEQALRLCIETCAKIKLNLNTSVLYNIPSAEAVTVRLPILAVVGQFAPLRKALIFAVAPQ